MTATGDNSRRVAQLNTLAILIFCFGLSQMLGYVFNIKVLRGIGAASTFSPLPTVFSDVDGVETFASAFTIEYSDPGGNTKRLEITPKVFSQLMGPYNRRNVYGAALSYGPTPRFSKRLLKRVFEYGLIDPGPVRKEFGLPDNIENVKLHVRTKTRGRNDQWLLGTWEK